MQLHCYVFDIAPKQIVGKKRYFQGRIWVDDHDFQIVKTYGKAVPEIRDTKKKGKEEHLYPKFTTWREQIDNQYWFPTYTRADDTLTFNTGDIHIREIVKYEDYKRFGSNVKILYHGQGSSEGGSERSKAVAGSTSSARSAEAGRGFESATAEVETIGVQLLASRCLAALGIASLQLAKNVRLSSSMRPLDRAPEWIMRLRNAGKASWASGKFCCFIKL